MTINIADNSPRISYSVASGVTQTSFAVPFEFFDDEDLNVYVDGVEKALTTDFTVSGGDGSTGTVTISVTGASGGSTVVITRDIPLERTTDFPVSGAFNIVALNTELDRLVAVAADLDDLASRAITPLDYDPTVSYTLPTVDDRKGKTLAFNEVTGSVQAGPSIADTQSVADASADIALLADIQDGTVATNAITTAANVSSQIATLGAISSDITTVSGISSNVTTVASNDANVTTVAGISSNVTTVADNIADINTVADDLNEAVSEINTVATNITNVNTVGTNITNVNTTAGSINNVNTVASDITNVNTVSTNISNVNTVAGISANVTTVAGQTTNLQNVTDNLTAIQNAASNATSASDSATAAAASAAAAALSADTFDDTYLGSKASDPSLDNDGDALNAGDLYFNTTSNTLKVYSGSAWQDAAVDSSGFVQTTGDSMTGNLSFGDNDKAIFGAGSDLQIYHDGSNSYIKDAGTGVFLILGDSDIWLQNSTGTASYARFTNGGAATLYYDNSPKLTTTSTGVDITGTLTSDGLTVDGKAEVNGVGSTTGIQLDNGAQAHKWYLVDNFTNRWDINTSSLGAIYNFGSNNGARNHLQITTGGDISFYEDTGTTAKLQWSASNERLFLSGSDYQFGIGQGSNQPWYSRAVSDGSYRLHLNGTGDIITADSSGNVGIGTSSPSSKLHLQGSTGGYLELKMEPSADTDVTSIAFRNAADNVTKGYVLYDHTSNYMGFRTNGSGEAMRIDSSGNLLVGKTSTGLSGSGSYFQADGAIVGTREPSLTGDAVFYANRLVDDGNLFNFYKDGSTVGSIGVADGDNLYIASTATDHAGFKFSDTTVTPWVNNTNSDNAMDIGAGVNRFKDLYLSGGVYLGGTGAANKLDDYEEGTWTIGFTGATITPSNSTGYYTKIGNRVFVQYYSGLSTISGASGSGYFTGLPFTVASGSYDFSTFNTAHNTYFGGSATVGVSGFFTINATSAQFITTGFTSGCTYVNGSGKFIMLSGFYYTNS